MHRKTVICRWLCLLLLCTLLVGCSPPPPLPNTQGESTAPPVGSEPTGAEQTTASEPGEAAHEAEPTPTTAPETIRLSAGEYRGDQESLTAVVTPEDLALLEEVPNLKTADFRGSDCQEDLVRWALAHPGVSVRCEVRLPDGTTLPADTRELDLTEAETLGDLTALCLLPDLLCRYALRFRVYMNI